MTTYRKRKFVWLSPNKLHTFLVKAWNRNYESDWSTVTLNLSAIPDLAWDGGAGLQAKPIWWNRSIRLLWTPFPTRYRKWFDHYIIFRKKGSVPGAFDLADAATKLEDSDFFLTTTGERKAKFLQTSPGLAFQNYYFDFDIEEEEGYFYWVYAVSQKGDLSSNYLGPNNAEWGKPQTPNIVWFETQVHEINKWWCDVKVWWDSGPNTSEPAGAEYYIIQRKQKNKVLWGPPLRIEHDYDEGRYQSSVLSNFIVGRDYEFRVRAVNVPGIGPDALVSPWSSIAEYTTLTDTNPPPEVTGVAANRFYWRGINKGDYVRLRWDRFWANDPEGPRAPILTEQVAYYNIYRIAGSDAEASAKVTAINLHAGYAQDPGGTKLAVYSQSGKFEGTHFIDDNVEDTSGLGGGDVVWDFVWTCEGADDTARRTATLSGGTVTGTVYGGANVQSVEQHLGTYSLEVPSGGYMDFDNQVNPSFNGDEGYIDLWVKSGFITGDIYFEARYDGSNTTYFEVLGSGNLIFSRRGAGTLHTCGTTKPSAGSWHRLEARWSLTGNSMSMRIDGGAWNDANTTTPLSSFVGNPSTIVFGSLIVMGTTYIDDAYLSLSYTPEVEDAAYHYWVSAVDVYDYESNVSLVDSYDKVTFAPPPAPDGLDDEQNYVGNFFKLKMHSLKLLWNTVDEATHYQVRIKIKPIGKKLDGTARDYSKWHYSPMLREERTYDDDVSGKSSYVYPFPLAAETLVTFAVAAWNRAGISATWTESSEITVSRDDVPPQNVAASTFIGDCMGVKPLFGFGAKLWLSIIFKWQPRPKAEGVDHYQINIYNPSLAAWEEVDKVNPVFGLDSDLFPAIRMKHTVLAKSLPDWLQGESSALFSIRVVDCENNESDYPLPETTVNWEPWWVF